MFCKRISIFLLDQIHLTSISVSSHFYYFLHLLRGGEMQKLWKLPQKLHKSCKAIGKSKVMKFSFLPVWSSYHGSQRKPVRCIRNGHWLFVDIQQEEEMKKYLQYRTRTSQQVHCRIHRFFCPRGLNGACSELPLHPSSWRTPHCFVPTLPTVEEN